MSDYLYQYSQPLSSAHLPHTSGVYEVVCLPTGQRYIGGTTNFKTRVRMHRHRGRTKTHTPSFNAAWAKWGEAAFTMRVIEETDDPFGRERWHIWQARAAGEDLFNTLIYRSKPEKPEKPRGKPRGKHGDHFIDIYTSTEPRKVLMERYGLSHAAISHIKLGKRGRKVLEAAGLI